MPAKQGKKPCLHIVVYMHLSEVPLILHSLRTQAFQVVSIPSAIGTREEVKLEFRMSALQMFGLRMLGLRTLGFRMLGLRALGFPMLGFRMLDFRRLASFRGLAGGRYGIPVPKQLGYQICEVYHVKISVRVYELSQRRGIRIDLNMKHHD